MLKRLFCYLLLLCLVVVTIACDGEYMAEELGFNEELGYEESGEDGVMVEELPLEVEAEDVDVAVTDTFSDTVVSGETAVVLDEVIGGFVAFIEEAMADGEIPGVAAALVQGDEVIFAEGFGVRNLASGDPVTTETLFHIGSTTKSMTAMLMATLVDDGYFDWDTPVVEIYPDFRLSDSDSNDSVTMRHLLSMTSGIPDEAENELAFEEIEADALFDLLAQVSISDGPGETYSYSNVSYAAAGYVGVIAEQDQADNLYDGYANLLRARLLEPIGMTDALVYASAAQASSDYARSYYWEGEPVVAEWFDVDGDSLAPSGVLKAHVVDMARYVLTQLNAGVAPDGTQVVSAENLAETWQPILDGYGLGWQVTEHDEADMIWHDGSYDEFGSVIGFMPAYDAGFVILTNCMDCAEEMIEAAERVVYNLFAVYN